MFRRKYSVLMVRTANICRSPMAEGMFRQLVRKEGLAKKVKVDSAGTRAMKGHPPDARAQAAVRRWGAELKRVRGRGIRPDDFSRNDLILCMEQGHRTQLLGQCPVEYHEKINWLFTKSGG